MSYDIFSTFFQHSEGYSRPVWFFVNILPWQSITKQDVIMTGTIIKSPNRGEVIIRGRDDHLDI